MQMPKRQMEKHSTSLIKIMQINKIRNEKGEVATDNEEIQRLVRGCYEQVMEIK